MIEKVNLKKSSDKITQLNEYLKIGQLNDHMLNIIHAGPRVLDFHVHEDSDEMFLVFEGSFQMEFEDGFVDINEGDFIIVQKGTKHRPVIKEMVKCLLIEKDGTLTKDNTGGTYKE